MPGTDFFDDDLARQRERGGRIRTDEPAVPVEEGGSLNAAPRQVADLNLTRMARHREEVNTQMATAKVDIERMRRKQSELEREKQSMEELLDAKS